LGHKSKSNHSGTQKANEEDERKRGQEKAKRGAKKKENLFENHFRSGGEENERQMANNVMQDMRVYDGYLVCLDLA
jgi:hypothetical protein